MLSDILKSGDMFEGSHGCHSYNSSEGLAAENQRAGRQSCSGAAPSTTKFTLRSNPDLRDEPPATDDVRGAAGFENYFHLPNTQKLSSYLTENTACPHSAVHKAVTLSS